MLSHIPPPIRLSNEACRSDIPPAVGSARSDLHIALVSMPFVSIVRPAIQIGLLKAIAMLHGFSAEAFNLNLDFAKQIDVNVYEAVCEFGRYYIGDWLFSQEAFKQDFPDRDEAFLEDFGPVLQGLSQSVQLKPDYLLHIRREEVPKYIDRMLDSVDWGRFRIVGFTSTFQQSVASIALANRLKETFPSLTIVFGGSNFEAEMGTEFARTMTCADYVFAGEADEAFPEFVIALHEGRDPSSIPGVVCRRNGCVTKYVSRPPFERMDDLPAPDYDDYFQRVEALELLSPGPRRVVRIPFESARGCWWGAKHHCTFCGGNGLAMKFRAKSSTRLLDELSDTARRYRSFSFSAVDNIMAFPYLETLCSELIRERPDYDLFYEVKANLTREQLRRLRDAGIGKLQAGIESLSSKVLTLMNKGVSAIQNVNTLRWARYYGIQINWNLLYGFPGETSEDYALQIELLRKVAFLEPPSGAGRVWVERFSPMFQDRVAFPMARIAPLAVYAYIYPPRINLHQLAYFFDYEFENSLPASTYTETINIVDRWKASWKCDPKPRLAFLSTRGFIQIEDTRDESEPGTYTFEDPLASLYMSAVDRPISSARVKEKLGLAFPVAEIEDALDEFCRRGLMMRDGNLFLSLALPSVHER
jgi:ribosomal peptide maturation radical SAM protein 1